MIVYLAQSPSGKVYIGITSKTLQARINSHKICSKRYTHYKFYRAFAKYGLDNFNWFILRDVDCIEEAYKWEKFYIKFFNSIEDGYNICSGGQGTPGRKLTKEQSIRCGIGQKRRFTNQEQREILGKIVKEWYGNLSQIDKDKLNNKRITVLKTEHYRQQAAFKQKYYAEQNPEKMKEHGLKLQKFYNANPEKRVQISRSLGGKPIQVYKDGNFIRRFETIHECAKTLNLNIGNIDHVLSGRRNHTGGYTFKRVSDADRTEKGDALYSNDKGRITGEMA